jgi:hypothetical protein
VDSPGDDVVQFGSAPSRRPPWLVPVVLAVAVVAALVVVVAQAGHHARHAAAAPLVTVTHARPNLLGVTARWELFARGADDVVAIQLASGTITTTQVPALASNNPQVAFLVGPHQAVIRSYDQVPGYLVPDGAPARPLAGALAADEPGPLLPGPAPGQAWVLAPAAAGRPSQTLDLVTLDGRPAGTSVRLPPAGAVPATAIPDGRGDVLVLTTDSGIYDAGPSGYRHVSGGLLAVGPARWLEVTCQGHACRNVVVNPATGAATALAGSPPRAAFAWPTLGVTAPDGSFAAVAIAGRDDAVLLRIVDLRTGAITTADVRLGPTPGYQTMAWSPDSDWLFVITAEGRLMAVDPRTGRATTLGVPLPPLSQIAVRAAPGP